jgi:lactate permease
MSVGATALLAALPIALILVLMLALRWSAATAGIAGFGAALALAVVAFGYGSAVYPQLGPSGALAGVLAEAGFTAGTILWIIFPALCIYQLQTRTRATEVIRGSIARLSPDPRIQAILVAWFFALFLEGAAGFGTPVALTAPLLVGAGFGRVEAVVLAMIGHAAGVSFGAVGTPVMPQIAVTPYTGPEIARATGIYHAALGWVMLVILTWIAGRTLPAPRPGGRRIWLLVAVAAVCFLLPFWLLAYAVGPELPTLGGALAGGLLFVLVLRGVQPRHAANTDAEGDGEGGRALLRAAAPYLALVLLILATRMIPPVRAALTGVQWEWSLWEPFRGSVLPLYHPGTMVFAGFCIGALVQGVRGSEIAAAMGAAARQLAAVTIALLAMLSLSRLLVHAGMIDALAQAAAGSVGWGWPLVGPFVGTLGTFVTGSATASNILFTDFQRATAEQLGLPVLAILGVQGFGAAVGNIICPHNIIAGGATVGLSGREGEVLRNTILPCLAYAGLGGLLAMIIVYVM